MSAHNGRPIGHRGPGSGVGRLRLALPSVAVLGAALLLGGCSSNSGPTSSPTESAQDTRLCGLFDPAIVTKAGLAPKNLSARGQIADRPTRHDNTIECVLTDTARTKTFVLAIVAEKYPEELAATRTLLASELRNKSGRCTQPEVVTALGDGYACSLPHGVELNVLRPNRLVRLDFHPTNGVVDAATYATAAALVADLDAHVEAFDRTHG